MRGDKAARYRSRQREGEGIIMLDCLWKTKHFQDFLHWYHIGWVLWELHSALHLRPKKQSFTQKIQRSIFKLLTWQNLTPHHYWGVTALRALSSVGKTEKKKKTKTSKPVHQETTHWPALKCNISRFCVFLFRLVRIVLSLHSLTHSPVRLMHSSPGKTHMIDGKNRKAKYWVFRLGGRLNLLLIKPKEINQHKFKYTTFVEQHRIIQDFYCRGSNYLPYVPETYLLPRQLLGNTVVLGAKYILHTVNI